MFGQIKEFFVNKKLESKFVTNLDLIIKNNENYPIEVVLEKCFELKNDFEVSEEFFQKKYEEKIEKIVLYDLNRIKYSIFNMDIRNKSDLTSIINQIIFKYKLSKEEAKKTILRWKDNLIDEYFIKILEDDKIDKIELENFNNLITITGIQITNSLNEKLEKIRKYWEIDCGIINPVLCDINLRKNEFCYFKIDGIPWKEEKSITERVNYHGPRMRIKIARGLYYTAGSSKINIVKKDVLQTLDIGTVYLTNNRLIFIGDKISKSIKLSSILDFDIYQDGVQIFRDTGKSIFLNITKEADIFSLILNSIFKEKF